MIFPSFAHAENRSAPPGSATAKPPATSVAVTADDAIPMLSARRKDM